MGLLLVERSLEAAAISSTLANCSSAEAETLLICSLIFSDFFGAFA
ncbi:hypothetical protein [Paenibacillus helianthi]|nr:hypothetical protein [Paenibacillus helianthi]